jgi:hypothetical protein
MIKGIFSTVLVIIITLLLLEGMLHIYYRHGMITANFFTPSSTTIGYALRGSYSQTYYHGNKLLTVDIDNMGHRLTPGNNTGSFKKKIHIIGDSQVFGWGLPDSATIASRLQNRLGDSARVINHGVPGYGPFAYKDILSRIPFDETVVILFSEQNDFWDAYTAKSTVHAQSGYLVGNADFGKSLPGWLLDSRSFQVFAMLKNRLSDQRFPLPVCYNPYAEISAKVLQYRINALFAEDTLIRERRLLFGTIPWDGLISEARRKLYYPYIGSPRKVAQFPDELFLDTIFLQYPQKELLYLDGDNHLAAKGADLIAQTIYQHLH